ncbi:hypothetical protein [Flavobacterium sp. AG291]|uniref:hypothetical protein n=1 Tax=Flavobacterium sp. AG291 TaxID=2184000 RepID=UPI000E0B3059|nr:hypothetical protein [Flavobacterium sp. AG291]RDI13303.1 hypothetical protein DEU42_103214 [Flavobacterium sp. AG291]
MERFEITGGARIGIANASWPFATLKVSKEKLEVNASIVGNLVFGPNDVVSIKPYTVLPLIGQGIKINHRVDSYNQNVIFWTFKDPLVVINQIMQVGFLDKSYDDNLIDEPSVIEQQQKGGFPIKKSVAIGIIVVWNMLLLLDVVRFVTSDGKGTILGVGAIAAVWGILFMAVLSLLSKGFSKLILKEGRSASDINKFLYLLIFICCFILFQMFLFRSWSK